MTDQEYTTKLTDALVLIKDVCLDYDGFRTVDGLKSLIDEVRNIAIEALRAKIHKAPTEDVAPVVHAHWIKNKGYMLSRCSACQNTIPLGREYKHKYCPNCGAKMDEEGEENEQIH